MAALRPVDAWAHLTILLPLKDRSPFTRRWLDYASSAGLRCRILLADGSTTDDAAEIVSQRTDLAVEYLRYPPDISYTSYFTKIADALARVTTPFVVMADNDDLFVANGLARATEFLIANPEYVACGGQCAVFWLDARDAALTSAKTYGDVVEWKSSSLFSTDVADRPSVRLRERCLGANDVFYAVHRTEHLRSHFAAVRDCNPRDLFLMEQLVMFLTAIAGKTRQIDTLYIARQQDSPGSSGGAHQAQFGDWYDRMLVPTWSEDFTRFVDCATAALMQAESMPCDEAKRIVIDSYKASVAPSLLGDVLDEPTVSATMPITLQVVRHLVRLPDGSVLRRATQWMYRHARWLSHDFVHGTEFRTRRAQQAASEFAPVREFLVHPPRQRS